MSIEEKLACLLAVIARPFAVLMMPDEKEDA